jgi:hypothetical protein
VLYVKSSPTRKENEEAFQKDSRKLPKTFLLFLLCRRALQAIFLGLYNF